MLVSVAEMFQRDALLTLSALTSPGHTYEQARVSFGRVVRTPVSALLEARGKAEALCILKGNTGRPHLCFVLRLLRVCVSYYVRAERPEGVGPARVQVSLVVALQEADVVAALGLQRETHREEPGQRRDRPRLRTAC